MGYFFLHNFNLNDALGVNLIAWSSRQMQKERCYHLHLL